MDDTAAEFHDADMDFVGWWKATGDITNSLVYRLPHNSAYFADGSHNFIGGDTHLRPTGISGTGTQSDPYLVDFEWAKLVRGTSFDFDAGVTTGGYYKIRGLTTGGGDVDVEIVTGQTSQWYLRRASSSARYKENIENIDIDTSKILDLVPRIFTWKEIPDVGEELWNKKGFGLIAEEVYDILPELVSLDENNAPLSVKYKMIGVLLLEEVKKLKARIEVLEGS